MKVEGMKDGGMAPLLIREDPGKRQLLQTQPPDEVVGFLFRKASLSIFPCSLIYLFQISVPAG